MPLGAFEIACAVVVALTLAWMARARPLAALCADYAALAVAAWLGEASCIALYGYYDYAPAWHARLLHVPVLVPLIWPLVILSAREVATSLWPGGGLAASLRVAAVVAFDASLVEVIAVAGGLWSWVEPGHLGVPLAGVAGWAFFAFAVDATLRSRLPGRHLALIAIAPLGTHALILATWWLAFRWGLRRPLEPLSLVAVALVAAPALALVVAARRSGRALPLPVAGPRVVAASLFLALLVLGTHHDAPLVVHAALVAVPYLAATRFAT